MAGRKRLLVLGSTYPRWPDDPDPPFVHELARRLADDFEVHALVPGYPGARGLEDMDGVRVHRFRYFLRPFERLAGGGGILPTLRKNPLYLLVVPFFLLAGIAALFRLARRLRPDVIHAHWVFPQGWAASLLAGRGGPPFVVTAHGGDVFGLRQGWLAGMKRTALRRAVAVTVVSRALALEVERMVPGVEPMVAPMGVDAERFSGRGDGEVRRRFGIEGGFILFVGRLSAKKGVEYLLRAMPAVLAVHPDTVLVVVGHGEEEAALRDEAAALGLLDGAVRFAGAVPNRDLPVFYGDADVFVAPSVRAVGGDTEGFGLTLVEAGMSGCMLVASDVGGIRDIVRPGETGFLVPEKDPAALADTLAAVLECRDDWPGMRERVRREFAARFDWRVAAQRYAEIIAAAACSDAG